MTSKNKRRKSKTALTNEPTNETAESSTAMINVWVKGQIPKTKQEGASILYDEPGHAIDHLDAGTWPPMFVLLSSAWVHRVVRNENIPHTTRYTAWPTTFGSKAGLQSTWRNMGSAARVFNEEQNTWHYPIVFNTMQLHGEEGEKAGLGTGLIAGKPHNKHTITLGRVCVSKNEELQALDTPSSTQSPDLLASAKKKSSDIRAHVGTSSSSFDTSVFDTTIAPLSTQSPRLHTHIDTSASGAMSAPPNTQTPAPVEDEDTRRRRAYVDLQHSKREKRLGRSIPKKDQNLPVPSQVPILPPAGRRNAPGPTVETAEFPNLFHSSLQEPEALFGTSTSDTQIWPDDYFTSTTPDITTSSPPWVVGNTLEVPRRAEKRSMGQSSQENKRIKTSANLVKEDEGSTSRGIPILGKGVPSFST